MTTLVCLHGWGGSKESFAQLREALKGTDIKILTPDLPGFGDEPEPKKPWHVEDYANWVTDWVDSQLTTRNSQLVLLGHSLGGQIAAMIAAREAIKIDHLILCAPAIVRSRMGLRRSIGLMVSKTGKVVLAAPGLNLFQPVLRKVLYKLMRVHDYEKASPVMQKTLVNVTHQPVTNLLPKISAPTDIFWGQEDRQTPLREAFIVKNGITGSTLHTYKGVRHGVHRDRAMEIAEVIKKAI